MAALAARLVAASLLGEHSFFEVLERIAEIVDPEAAFNITMRAKRGLKSGADLGGYMKDHLYLQGMLDVELLVDRFDGYYELLMSAKMPGTFIRTMKELRQNGVMRPPLLMPADLFASRSTLR